MQPTLLEENTIKRPLLFVATKLAALGLVLGRHIPEQGLRTFLSAVLFLNDLRYIGLLFKKSRIPVAIADYSLSVFLESGRAD